MGNLPAEHHRDLARPEPPEPQHIIGRIIRDTTPVLSCLCGNATDRGHNGFTCAAILRMRRNEIKGMRREERRGAR